MIKKKYLFKLLKYVNGNDTVVIHHYNYIEASVKFYFEKIAHMEFKFDSIIYEQNDLYDVFHLCYCGKKIPYCKLSFYKNKNKESQE